MLEPVGATLDRVSCLLFRSMFSRTTWFRYGAQKETNVNSTRHRKIVNVFFICSRSQCIFSTQVSFPINNNIIKKIHTKTSLGKLDKEKYFFFCQVSNLKSLEFCAVSDHTQNFITFDAEINKTYELRNSVTGLSYRVVSCRVEPCRVAT